MVASSSAAKTTAVVSIHEEKNTEVEIPRIDPEDKPKLWISKIEIRHNTMMTKIQGMVQEKLFEQVVNNDDFFAGVEDITLEIDDDDEQKQQKPETEEDILLAKKAQLLQSHLNAIMELPKEEILKFLTSSSLPTGLNRSFANLPGRQPEPETLENSACDTSGINSSEDTSQSPKNHPQQQDQNYDAYNWILDTDDAWEDLPAVVRVNAIELGYTETLWDEDAQDLPIFRILWKKLTPNQRTAAVFLGNYDEPTWNDDVRMLLLGGNPPALASLTDPEEEPVADIAQQKNDDRDIVAKNPQDDTRYDSEEEDAMIDESLSNFGVSTDEEDGADSGNERNPEKESTVNTSSVIPKNDNEEEAMMEEFLSNFEVSVEYDEDTDSSNEKNPEVLNDENDDEEEDEAMMDEFLSNFVVSNEEEGDIDSDDDHRPEKESQVPREGHIPGYESIRGDSQEDEEQPLVSKPKESIMERGFQGEESPLLPSNKETNKPQKPDPPSTWESLSSYLYWIPVIVGLPVVYLMANGSNQASKA
jgi:hypothetical protein